MQRASLADGGALVNIEIMPAFFRLRRLLAMRGELVERIAKLSETVELPDDQIKAIAGLINKMLAEPPKPQEMGFHTIGRKWAKRISESAKGTSH